MTPLFELRWTDEFGRQFDNILSAYPKSKGSVRKYICETLPFFTYLPGTRYPGFGENVVYKVRLGLKEHRLSKRDGLRLLYLVTDSKIIPLLLYKKGEKPKKEEEVKAQALKHLKAILQELTPE